MKRKREMTLFTPAKRILPNLSVGSFFAENDSPFTKKKTAHALSSTMIAVLQGNLEILKYHVQTSNSSLAQKRFGPFSRNLLHLSACSGNLELVRYCREKLKTELMDADDKGHLPIDLANNPEVRSYLCREMNWENRKAFIWAAGKDVPMLKKFSSSLVRYIAEHFL